MSSLREPIFSEHVSRTPSSDMAAVTADPLGFEDNEPAADIVDQDRNGDGDGLGRITRHAVVMDQGTYDGKA